MTSKPPDLPLAFDFAPADRAQWLALVEKVLKGGDFAKRLVSRTADGLEIQPLYTRDDATADAGVPGVAPFTRGPALRAGTTGWLIGQLYAESAPAALASAIALDTGAGVEAISVRVAGPGQTGLPVDPRAFEAALGGALSGGVRVSLEPGAQVEAAQVLAALAKARGAERAIGRFGIDPLGTLVRMGELYGLTRDGTGFTPGLPWLPAPATTLLVDGRPYHEAGGSEAQELASIAGTLVGYLKAAEAGGRLPNDALAGFAFALAADADIFLTIAKLRAARRLVWRIAESCGAGDAAGVMQLSVSTSERMMARRDPWVNMLQVTAACAAAAMGGADEITVLPFTWALGQPDGFARRIARNVGLVLREEASLGRVADPAGGSFYVERLTEDLAAKAWGIFQEWEAEGGMLAALTSGLVQEQIAATAEQRAKAIATGRIELTGASAFPRLGDDSVKVTPWPAAPAWPASPLIKRLEPRRLAEPFERLRDAADAAKSPPRVFLAPLGTPADFGARANWMANFLAAGGIAVIAADGFTSSADTGRAFAESGAAVACICSSDKIYAELAEATAMALKGAGATHVMLAGRPREQEAALKAAGVDRFVYAGVDAIGTLTALHAQLGVIE